MNVCVCVCMMGLRREERWMDNCVDGMDSIIAWAPGQVGCVDWAVGLL